MKFHRVAIAILMLRSLDLVAARLAAADATPTIGEALLLTALWAALWAVIWYGAEALVRKGTSE